jgi:hypothetical protein
LVSLTLARKLRSVVGERNSELCNYAIVGESARMIEDIPRAITERTDGCCRADARKSASLTTHHRR